MATADPALRVGVPGGLQPADARAHPAPATDATTALLARLVARGVRHIVVSPGSRSQALALAALHLQREGRATVHVRVDERVAGFTALGIARETRMPAVVVCTSGTATAGLLPAVMEADHAGVPLIAVTADRPPELRGVGANQTTRQPGMYGAHTRWQVDMPVPVAVDPAGDAAQSVAWAEAADRAVDAALGEPDAPLGEADAARGVPGPVHVNVPLREPLSGDVPAWAAAASAPRNASVSTGAEPVMLARGPRTIVVAGADAGDQAEAVSYAGGWPLVAEIVSGARYGRYVVHGYRALLGDPDLGARVERVVVFGHPTLSREVTALLSRRDVDVIAVDGPGERLDLNGATVHAAAVDVARGAADRAWLGAWMRASHAAVVDVAPPAPDVAGLASVQPHEHLPALAAEVKAFRMPLDRRVLVDAVWRATWPHDRLVFGSSRLVRVADAILPGKKVPVHANRGLAGIDGTVSTALGVALASQADGAPGVTRVLLGDLTLLHDVGALAHPADEPEPRIQVVVGNDGGGTIFDGLEVADTADPAALDRMMYTPLAVDLQQLAAAYGWTYHRVETRSALDQLLAAPISGRHLIDVPLDR